MQFKLYMSVYIMTASNRNMSLFFIVSSNMNISKAKDILFYTAKSNYVLHHIYIFPPIFSAALSVGVCLLLYQCSDNFLHTRWQY